MGRHDCIEHSAVMEDGVRVWKEYTTLFVDGEDFISIGSAFEKEHAVSIGPVGCARSRLMNQRALVDYAVKWIKANRNR